MEVFEKALKEKLGIDDVKPFGSIGGGDICEGQGYQASNDQKVYVKTLSGCSPITTENMFKGEYESLKAISDTITVKVPKPMFVINAERNYALVTEYLNIRSLSSKHSATFGKELARMHKYNEEVLCKVDSSSIHDKTASEELFSTTQFGFHAPTFCGRIPQQNEWMDDWVEFFSQQKLQAQINLVEEKYGDRQTLELWSALQLIIPKFFRGLSMKPSLIHGDMWSGNVGQTLDMPVLFDPSSFYGHSEFEFGIATIFSSSAFNRSFYEAYHEIIPRSEGFNERQKLYQLFHYLNHWNHFGGGYRGSSISIMKELTK